MDYRILIKIYFPIVEKNYEAYIPTNKTVGYVTSLLQKIIQENYPNTYKPNDNPILCNKINGERYEIDKLIIDTNIRNGSKLILI